MLKFYYVGDYNRSKNSKIKLGVSYLIEPPLESSPIDKMLPLFKKWQYTFSNQVTNVETIIL